MFRSQKFAMLIMSAAIFSTSAHALTADFVPAPAVPAPTGPLTFKDWRVEERASAESALGVCVAGTSAMLGTTQISLEVIVDKSATRPIEVRIRPHTPLTDVRAIKGAIDQKRTKIYSFARLASLDAGAEVFWNVPRGTADLVSFLKREMRFDVSLLDSSVGQLMTFSLRGSSAALSDLQKRCNGNQVLGGDGFERDFLPAIVANVDPTQLDATATATLRGLLAQALGAWRTSKNTQASIEVLTSRYLTQINELARLQLNLDRLTQRDVANLQRRRTTAEGAIATAQTQIDQIRPQITAQEAELVQANLAYEAAYAILRPHIARHDELASDVRRARNTQSEAEAYLAQIDSGVAQARQQISDLTSQLNSAQSQLSQAQWDLNNATSESNRAAHDYNSYDPQSEARRRISQDSELSNIEYQLRNLDGRERQAQNDLNNAQNALRQAQSRYNDAGSRLQNALSAYNSATARRDQALRDLQQCEQTPDVDCSSYKSAANNAGQEAQQASQQADALRSEVARAQGDMSGPQSDARRAHDECDRIRRERDQLSRRRDERVASIHSEIDRHHAELLATYNSARSRFDAAQGRFDSLNATVRDLQQTIPRWQSQLSSLQAQRPGAVSGIRSAQNAVARAVREREAFDQSVDYDGKKLAVTHATNRVNTIQATLRTLDSDIKKREKLIRDNQTELATVQRLMDQVMEVIRQKMARSTELQRILEPYDQQKAVLLQTKAASDQQFNEARTAFTAALPQLAAPAPTVVP